MELALIILVIGIVFMLNNDNGISKGALKKIAKQIDIELSKEFEKRDIKIRELEERIKALENNS